LSLQRGHFILELFDARDLLLVALDEREDFRPEVFECADDDGEDGAVVYAGDGAARVIRCEVSRRSS
jgi:hypothetical protein